LVDGQNERLLSVQLQQHSDSLINTKINCKQIKSYRSGQLNRSSDDHNLLRVWFDCRTVRETLARTVKWHSNRQNRVNLSFSLSIIFLRCCLVHSQHEILLPV